MDVLILIGRTLFALIFLASGFAGHFGQTDGTAGYAQMRGLKNARPLVQLSGVWIIVGALSVILGVYADVGFLLLGAYALTTAILIHHFWTDADAMTQQNEMSHFMKNLSMAGASLVMFVFFAAAGPAIDFQITDPLFEVTL